MTSCFLIAPCPPRAQVSFLNPLQSCESVDSDLGWLAQKTLGSILPSQSGVQEAGQEGKYEKKQQISKKVRKRGGGGAWRAFVHCRLAGSRLDGRKAQQLSQGHWSLDVQDYEHYKQMGEAAREFHKDLGTSQLPAHSQRAEAARSKHSRQRQRRHRVPPHDAVRTTAAMNALEQGQSTPLLGAQSQTVAEQFHLNVLAFAHQISEKRVKEEVEQNRQMEALLSSELHKRVLEERRRLKEVPGARWHHLPHSCKALAVSFSPADVLPQSCTEQRGAREQSTRLAQAWTQRHTGLKDNKSDYRDPGLRRRACYLNHYCVCKGKGLHLQAIHRRFKAHLAKLCQDERISALLVDGKAAVLWISYKPQVPEGAPREEQSSRRVVHHNNSVHSYAVTHISLMYLRPWRPTVTHLETVCDSEERKLLAQPVEGPLQAEQLSTWTRFRVQAFGDNTPAVHSIWEHLDLFSLDFPIGMRLLELSTRHTPSIDLTSVCLKYVDAPGVILWKGSGAERRPGRGRPPPDPRQLLEQACTRAQVSQIGKEGRDQGISAGGFRFGVCHRREGGE